MLAKEIEDSAALHQCRLARAQEIAAGVTRAFEQTKADTDRGIFRDHPFPPDPPPCVEEATWQADVLWLTVNTPPVGVKAYSPRPRGSIY